MFALCVILGSVSGVVAAPLPLVQQPGQPVAQQVAGGEDAIVRRLIEALREPDFEVRQNLGAALAKVGTPCIEPLKVALKDRNPERRAGAAYALAIIGPAARSALPALLDALNDTELEVRRQASYAISRVMTPARTTVRAAAVGKPLVSAKP